MVNMGMAENRCLDRANVEWEVTIALNRFTAPALEKAALEEDSLAVEFQQVHRACGGARGAEKMNSHWPKNAVGAVACKLYTEDATKIAWKRRPSR